MGGRYMVTGRTAATAATADNVGGAFWNPHATKPVFVYELYWFKTVATADNPAMVRTSTKGTVTTAVTPDVDNDYDHVAAPISISELDITYSAQPTLSKPYLGAWPLGAAIGMGFMWVASVKPILVKAGEGLAIATAQAVILQPADFTVVWEE